MKNPMRVTKRKHKNKTNMIKMKVKLIAIDV